MSIVVFGSLNMDLVIRTPRFPLKGETLIGHSFETVPGGKGANQAVACATMGGSVRLVGQVGDDNFGRQLKESLKSRKVNIEGIRTKESVASGVALITVEDSGENNIIIVPGANELSEENVADLEEILKGNKILLLQLEIPLPVVVAAAKVGRRLGLKVILDPAPAQELPESLYQECFIITPNETEAAHLVGFPLRTKEDVRAAGDLLLKRGATFVVIKMGKQGVYWAGGDEGEGHFIPAPPVEVIDTVAAGDAFNGALAVALSEGQPPGIAIEWGIAAGALAVTRKGAQGAMPEMEEVLALLSPLSSN